MINTPQTPENTHKNITPNKDELLHTLNEDTQTFFRKLEFVGLNYDKKRDLVDNFEDELTDFLYKENIERWNLFMKIPKEIIKNCADHSDSNAEIEMTITRDKEHKKITIKFLISDEGPGLHLNKEQIEHVFNTYRGHTNRGKKGSQNAGIGLNLTRECAKDMNLDLILHNQGEVIHINDIGLQKNVQARDKFGYEGYGVFAIVEK